MNVAVGNPDFAIAGCMIFSKSSFFIFSKILFCFSLMYFMEERLVASIVAQFSLLNFYGNSSHRLTEQSTNDRLGLKICVLFFMVKSNFQLKE